MKPKFKPLLVVTNAETSFIALAEKNIIYVNSVNSIFPAMHEVQPCGIVLDHDYMGNDVEKALRRIRSNPFYKKIKVYCYKSCPNTKTDDTLKALGIQQFIYSETATQPKTKNKTLNLIIENVFSTIRPAQNISLSTQI